MRASSSTSSRWWLLATSVLLGSVSGEAPLVTKAWRGAGMESLPPAWPESALPELSSRENVGLVMSGGGSRSFIVSLGYLKAFVDLGLIGRVRYLSGTSGGSWATSLFTFASTAVAPTDAILLGNLTDPADIVLADLKVMDPRCGRAAATADFIGKVAGRILSDGLDGAWVRTVSEVYLENYGVSGASFPTWSAATAADVAARNPALAAGGAAGASFVTPRDASRPFPLLSISLLGPTAMVPFDLKTRRYTILEATPLYAGVPRTHNATYHKKPILGKRTAETRQIGGLVEPWAVMAKGGAAAPMASAAEGSVVLRENSTAGALTIGLATAASSYAPGDVVSSWSGLTSSWGIDVPYWPLQTAAEAAASGAAGGGLPQPVDTFTLGDGGNMENPNLISLLQRRVGRIIVCCNFNLPLAPRAKWDPHARAPTDKDIDNDLPAFFGIEVASATAAGYFLELNTVFNGSDFARVASELQDAAGSAGRGRGAVATTPLVTVANDWWGIPAGFQVNVTWIYLSRAREWEQQLSPEMFAAAVSPKDPNCTDPTVTPSKGDFKHFPHYSTETQIEQSNQQANLLADLAGWTIKANADILFKVFDSN